MKMKLYIPLGLLLLLGSQSCTKAVIDDVDPGTLPPITKTIKYNPDIQAIMYNNCVTCHGGVAPSAGLLLNNYNDVKASAQNGSLISRMNNTSAPMPPNGVLSPELRQLVDKWKEDGFLEN